MRPKTKLPEGTLMRMLELSKKATNAAELRRIQCIIFRVRDDMDAVQIAQTVGLHPSTVRNLHSAFMQEGEGALKLKPKGGRYRENLSVEEEKALLNPFLKEAEQGGVLEISPIKRVYEKNLGRKVPASTIYRLLHRHGWRKIVPRPTHPKSDKQTMECFKKKLPIIVEEASQEAQAKGLTLRVMFQDEARFGRVNEPRRCWAARGCRPEVKKQMVREYTYAYVAASPKDGVTDSLVLPLMNTEAMNVFLEEVGRRHAQEYILMILDGASSHKSKELKVPENMHLEKLPPYSPQLNPVENLWEEVREKYFRNRAFESMDAVEAVLIEALLHLEGTPETITSITQFPWIISRL